MNIAELAKILGVLGAVIALAELARKTRVPYPTLMVVAGLLISLVPGLPHVSIDPEAVFLVFLPPILYAAAWNTWLEDFRRHAVAISFLAIGLVIFTAVVVAQVCVMVIPGMRWWHGFLLGAIISPPDAAAATAICQRLGVSRRIVTILEGESLVNDASGLIAYRVAIGAITLGSFSAGETAQKFIIGGVGGVIIGLVAGFVIAQLHKRVRDPMVTTALSLLAPYAAYLPAEVAHVSGVLATVAAGLYVSRRSPELFSAHARMQAVHVWQIVVLMINGVLFVLIGLQLDTVLDAVKNRYSLPQLALYAAAVCASVIVARLAWVFATARLQGGIFRSNRGGSPPNWQQLTVVGWTGMRGIVSLAAALALPETFTVAGTSVTFEFRPLIVLLTFSVIFATLVLQSLTLGPLIRYLGEPVREGVAHEELIARMMSASAAMMYLDTLDATGADAAPIARVRSDYLDRLEAATLVATGEREAGADAAAEDRIRHDALNAERSTLVQLRDRGEISEEIFRLVERDLDLEEARLTRSVEPS
jgi:CPA1 family monovalent cation:H+ antiporter